MANSPKTSSSNSAESTINGCTLSRDLDCSAAGGLKARRFGDVYFNSEDGAAESQHVFIEGNKLRERFSLHQSKPGCPFVIAETGFGSGLNFLACWQAWREASIAKKHSRPESMLYYYAIERYPLTRLALEKSIKHYAPFPSLAKQLLQQYPDPLSHCYLLDFDAGGVKLVLLFDDLSNALQQLEYYPHSEQTGQRRPSWSRHPASLAVDAWLLDGFAPDKNPDMWGDALEKIARYSDERTTAATFSVARVVRDRLTAAGFKCEKRKGFGRKREMLCASFEGVAATQRAPTLSSPSPCFYRYSSTQEYAPQTADHAASLTPGSQRTAAIIGAGIAGCSIANRLARDGWNVQVYDQKNHIAAEASGNELGVLYARTGQPGSLLGEFYESCFHFAQHFYQNLGLPAETLELNGMIQLSADAKNLLAKYPAHSELQSRKAVDRAEASRLAGIELSSGGLYYPNSGWLKPTLVCRQLLEHPNIHFQSNKKIDALQRQNGSWTLIEEGGETTSASNLADIVVLAIAGQSNSFQQANWLPLKIIRGQTTRLATNDTLQRQLRTVCGKGYLSPADGAGNHHLGATFNLDNLSAQARECDDIENLHNMHDLLANSKSEQLSQLRDDRASQTNGSRVAFRCISPDYLPVVGPLPDAEAFQTSFAALGKNAKRIPDTFAPLHDGLYISTAYGSRGFTSAPLCAEILAAQIDQRPIPASEKVRQNIAPCRFLLRQLIRGTSSANARRN